MDIKNSFEKLGENKENVLEKIKQCKNVQEINSLASEFNLSIDEEMAQRILDMKTKEKVVAIGDDELDKVAGGKRTRENHTCKNSKWPCCFCDYWKNADYATRSGECTY